MALGGGRGLAADALASLQDHDPKYGVISLVHGD